ncbi:Late-stage biofilm-induced protein [Candida albicans SC5314]|uniref:Uncharacterized protein CaJ7.0276 n=2 Tax=Candida albicans TaxID=5476 RepID=G1UA66_CANAX|nr:hypothetical protein MEU_05181 [Candida albicans P37005]KGR05205.1 hypothetical protein MG3_05200 [Candida albicans P78048]KGR09380.1 hypothetical protein MG9_05183 [Candida albicans P37037]KGT65030.1 hypothetical protein MEK_05181 [Candida albicans 12C]KGU24438.1 Late-stage biofilm-induced protein [Candida albicans P75063]KHC48638.1 Late-stage biofilm-induced protein [Candida albicans P37039]KHC71920.1 Late-stage biofilm-induced protein [Candida albicans SC5314]BAE44752.1 hypothetical pr
MLLPESINSQNLVKRIVYYSSYDDYSGWWKWRWLLWLLLLIPIFLTIFLIARRGRQNKVVAYNNPPDPQANEAYYNNNQYQGGYDNDLPPQATPGYGTTNYPETSQPGYNLQQQSGDYNSGEISRPEGPPQAHTKSY